MADDIKQIIQEANEGLRQDIRKVGIKVEAVQADMKQVLEGVEGANQRLDRLEPLGEKVEKIEDDVEVIKVTVQSIQHDLKGKADREELSALELKLRPS